MISPFPFCLCDGGLRVFVRLSPQAKKNAINALMADAEGQMALKVSVTAVPEKGKANARLIKLLSKEWSIAKSDIIITAGDTDRRKTLLLRGDPKSLQQRLIEWMKQSNVKS